MRILAAVIERAETDQIRKCTAKQCAERSIATECVLNQTQRNGERGKERGLVRWKREGTTLRIQNRSTASRMEDNSDQNGTEQGLERRRLSRGRREGIALRIQNRESEGAMERF
jgi:hypothetical protein